MQETFALKAKRAIKKVAAIGMGVAMLGTTIGGAAAYTLGDYPTPFIKDGTYNSVAYIIGDASTGEDTLALTSVTNKLATLATATSSGSATTATGGTTANVPLNPIPGLGIANTSSAGFDYELKQSAISTLVKTTLTYQSDTYNVHDEIALGRQTPALRTALTQTEEDFKTDVVMTFDQSKAIKYLYMFDSTINLSNKLPSTTQPLEIKFLGKNLKITSISQANKITATVGDEFFMTAGDTITVSGHIVKLDNVGTSSCVVSVDGGTPITITTGTTRTEGGIEVRCDSVVNRNELAESAATIIAGTTAVKSYLDGDAYVGENKVSPNWVWSLSALTTTNAATALNSTSLTPSVTAGPEIGIRSAFTKITPTDNPLKVGDCMNLPNNYLSVCFEGLTVDDDDYAEYTFEYLSSASLENSGFAALASSVKALHLSGPTEGFVFTGQNLPTAGQNGTVTDVKTKEIWITNIGTNTTHFVYKDTDGYYRYAGNISNFVVGLGGQLHTAIAKINYENTKDTDVLVVLQINNASAVADGGATYFNLTLAPVNGLSSTTWPAGSPDNLTMSWTIASKDFNGLGATASAYDANDLFWGKATSAMPNTVGSYQYDVRSAYGYILLNPRTNGNSDRVKVKIPAEQVLGKIRITGTATTEGGTGTTAPTPKTASEVTTLSSYNAILVGGPCVNKHVATLKGLTYPACGTASGFASDTAYIELVANGDKNALIVAGWEAADTRRAGVVLANYADTTIKAALGVKSAVTVKGTSLELTGITVA